MLGTKLADRYEILAELGRGGMGVVYRAKDPVLARDVAIKLIPPGNLTANAEERFLREAQIVAQMDHPAIVPIYDLGRHEGSLFFVMPVLPGTNLRHLLRDGSLRLGDVLDIGTQVAEALDYSHARGIVHRDIKPENIMTARDEGGHVRARVMDFGLALTTSEDRLTKTGTLVGTVSYFSPEQVTSRSFDGRTDTYALGTVLYESLGGEPPFAGEVQSILYRIVHELPQSLRALGADVSEELEAAILQCLEKDPEKRPKKAGHLAEELRRCRAKLHEDEYTRSVLLTASRMVARPAAASPFVGREKEMAELQKRLHAAVAGECQLGVVAGEPGIGKTRLVEELVSLARARKIRVLHGRFVEQDRAFAHQGFCELIQDYFRSRDAGSEPTSRPDLSDLTADLVDLFPVLSEIGELRSAGSDAKAPAAEPRKVEDRTSVFELLARTLTRIGGGRPLVLVLENLHGADASIEALQYVVRRLAPTPTLFLATYRSTEVERRHPLVKMLESFSDDPRFAPLALGPLTPTEHRALLLLSTGGGKLADSLSERLYEASEGNPFFTKELVRSLLDTKGITKDDTGAWSFAHQAGLSSDALPATIQQAIEKRIQRLPQELRDVLSVASLLGKAFEFRDLEVLSEDAKDLEESVDRLVAEGILEEDRESRGDRLAFVSGIVRDVLYGAFPRRKRRSLHRKYAEVLEKRYAGRLDRVYPELLHHFSHGDVPEKTVEYGLLLAQKSLDAFSPDEAVRVAKTALECLEDEDWSGDAALAGEARLLVAQAHRMVGDTDGALGEAEAAVRVLDAAKRTERVVHAMLFAAETAWQGRRAEEARRWVEHGIEAARKLPAGEMLTKLLSLAATAANLRGEYQKAAAYLAEIERLVKKEKAREDQALQGGTLVVALANPVAANERCLGLTTEEQEVLANVFETLVATDADGNLVPWLAESWAVRDGGRTVELSLRPEVRFSDGTPLTAAAVKAYWERAIVLRKDELPGAFTAIRGVAERLQGSAPDVEGLEASSEDKLAIHLLEPLAILPALLTDGAAAIGRVVADENGKEAVLGTGPFRVAQKTASRVLLERSPHSWHEPPPRLDAIEFRTSLKSAAIASGLREGKIELARDLAPADLEELIREPSFRAGLVEAPKKGTYFALFNPAARAVSALAVRRALAGYVRSQDFVWGALGRFALPATGLIPPGILGHDAGRRRAHLPKEKALELLQSAGLTSPIPLRVSVHPILQDRFRALTAALIGLWKELGVEVSVVTQTMAEFIATWQKPGDADVLLTRWIADYDDPDSFASGLFHSGSGILRSWFSSPETDRLFAEARVEVRGSAREAFYRRFESQLLESATFIPLFHEIDYRVAAPSVRGLALRSSAPFVNYSELGKAGASALETAPSDVGRGVVHVPIAGAVNTLDPVFAEMVDLGELAPNVFDTLTRHADGRFVPWLASELRAENELTRFRFRLRPGIRFHDGRALTARDVRFSFERLLQTRDSANRWLLAPIRGARALIQGDVGDLEGFHIVSPTEFFVDLEKPVSFFPVLVSHPSASIVPEGVTQLGATWREGCAGTGAFRVVRFEPGRRLELERNPSYWRAGFPKCEGLVFRIGMTPGEIKSEFLAGRLSIASDLLPPDVETLRHDPRFAPGYKETPRLVTYFLAFNTRRGVFRDAAARRAVLDALDVGALVRSALGRLALPANGLIPPGLLGATMTTRTRREAPPPSGSAEHTISRETLDVTAAVHPIFFGEYAEFFKELGAALKEIGYGTRATTKTFADFVETQRTGSCDVCLGRWIADYPDADSFIHSVLHGTEGILGRYCGLPEIDRLSERGRAEIDPRMRDSIYRDVEEILFREALLVPLFHEQIYRFARPEVEGVTVGFSYPVIPYENLWVKR